MSKRRWITVVGVCGVAALTASCASDDATSGAPASTTTAPTTTAPTSTTALTSTGTETPVADEPGGEATVSIVAATPSGRPVPGVTIVINAVSVCLEDGPDPGSTSSIAGKAVTGNDGVATFSATPGCYSFGPIEVPLGELPEPHGMAGFEVTTADREITRTVTFYESDPNATTGTITLVAEESGDPLPGETIWFAWCGGGNPGFFTQPTGADGRVSVTVPGAECLAASGLSNGPSPCSLVEVGEVLTRGDGFDLVLHASHPDAGVC